MVLYLNSYRKKQKIENLRAKRKHALAKRISLLIELRQIRLEVEAIENEIIRLSSEVK